MGWGRGFECNKRSLIKFSQHFPEIAKNSRLVLFEAGYHYYRVQITLVIKNWWFFIVY